MTRCPALPLVVLVLSIASFSCSKQKQTGATTTITLRSDTSRTEQSAPDSDSVLNPDSVYTRTVGPITTGREHLMNLYVRITHVHKHSEENGGWPDSDTSFVVVDSLGRELYRRRSVNEAGDAQTDFDCQQLTIPTIGSTLVWYSSIAPSYGPSGEDTQILGLDSHGKLVAYTSVMPASPLEVVFFDSRNKIEPKLVDPSQPYAQIALERKFSVGSFEIKNYFRVYPEGYREGVDPADFDFERIPVFVDTIAAERNRRSNSSAARSVLFCSKPSKTNRCSDRMQLRVDSRIEFLNAAYVGEWWLRVRIDGREGYVPSEDLPTLGLPDE